MHMIRKLELILKKDYCFDRYFLYSDPVEVGHASSLTGRFLNFLVLL